VIIQDSTTTGTRIRCLVRLGSYVILEYEVAASFQIYSDDLFVPV